MLGIGPKKLLIGAGIGRLKKINQIILNMYQFIDMQEISLVV